MIALAAISDAAFCFLTRRKKGYYFKMLRTERRNKYGKSAQRHDWLTANRTKRIIPETNSSRKEEAYGANEAGTVHHPRIGGTTYKVRVAFSETAAETMEEKILRMIRNEGVTNDGTYGIMEAPQMSRQSERSAECA